MNYKELHDILSKEIITRFGGTITITGQYPDKHHMSDEDRDIANAMISHGGSFVKHLGQAALHADKENLAIIKFAWPVYWNQYEEAVKHMKETSNKQQP